MQSYVPLVALGAAGTLMDELTCAFPLLGLLYHTHTLLLPASGKVRTLRCAQVLVCKCKFSEHR